jgi:NAD(P)H dehydrogenase (quinone)
MSKVLVLYYSSYGHIETMAQAVAEGARSAGATVDVKRVPETVPAGGRQSRPFQARPGRPGGDGGRTARLRRHHRRLPDPLRPHALANGELPSTRPAGCGRAGALHGKVGGAFTSTATQHGGQEVTLFSVITNLLHFGMVIVGLPYSYQGQMTLDEIVGGSPYGATTIAGGQGQRQPSANELDGARFQGKLIAETANKLFS